MFLRNDLPFEVFKKKDIKTVFTQLVDLIPCCIMPTKNARNQTNGQMQCNVCMITRYVVVGYER